jgi:predicted transcriptional regulator
VTDEDTQAMSIRLPRDLHEWLRRQAFETRTAMNAIVAEALSEYRSLRTSPEDQEAGR